jgi:DNA primase large subunit
VEITINKYFRAGQKGSTRFMATTRIQGNMIETRMIEIMEEKAEEALTKRNGMVKIRREDVDVDWLERPCIKSMMETAEKIGEIPHMGRLQIVTLQGTRGIMRKFTK